MENLKLYVEGAHCIPENTDPEWPTPNYWTWRKKLIIWARSKRASDL